MKHKVVGQMKSPSPRTAYDILALMMWAGLLWTPHENLWAEEPAAQDSPRPRVIQSYYDLPDGMTVMKEFRHFVPDIVKHFREQGMTLEPLSENAANSKFVGQSLVVNAELHGTVDGPFSCTTLAIQHPVGIRITFAQPQSVVAMTISGPTTGVDAGLELLFFDGKGKLIQKVNADTRHDPSLKFLSKGAVFRGLEVQKPIIASVHIVPTLVPEGKDIIAADIDYVCYRKDPPGNVPLNRIQGMVAYLGDKDFRVREEASKKLADLGPRYLPELRSMQDADDPEVSERLKQVIQSVEAMKINLTPNGHIE